MQHSGILAKRVDAVTNRTRLLTVARAVFAEAGLDLEMHDIASRAQLGVGTLYRHFGSREELLRAIVTQTAEDALAQMRLAIQPCAGDPQVTLQAFVAAGLRVQQQYQPIFAVIRDPRLTKLFDPAYGEAMRAQFLATAREVVERGIQAGRFRENLDYDVAAATIMGSFTGIFDLLSNNCPLDELEQRLTHLLWTMLAR